MEDNVYDNLHDYYTTLKRNNTITYLFVKYILFILDNNVHNTILTVIEQNKNILLPIPTYQFD